MAHDIKTNFRNKLTGMQHELDKLKALEIELKQAEELLRQEKEKSQKYFNIAGTILIVIDTKGNIVQINKRGSDVLGVKKEQIIGRNWFNDFIPKRLRDQVWKVHEQTMSGRIEQTEYYENPVVTENGKERIIAWHNSIVRDEVGNIIGSLSSGEDITERSRAQKRIDFLARALEASPVSVIATDSNGKISYCNEATAEMYGYKQEELIGRDPIIFNAEPDAENIQKDILYNVKRGEVWTRDLLNKKKDGTLFYVRVSVYQLLDDEGKFVSLIGFQEDITERKQAEEEIQRKTEDLDLICKLNNAANRGKSIHEILATLSESTKQIFSCSGATVYFMAKDKKHLIMEKSLLDSSLIEKVENLIKVKIPEIRISLKKDSAYGRVIREGKVQVFNDLKDIQEVIGEFTETKAIKAVIPKIQKILNINSVMIVPLISDNETIGLLDIGRDIPFTQVDMERLEAISGEITLIIKRKQIKEELQKSEEKYRSLIEGLSEAVYRMSLPEGKYEYFSPAAKEVFGYTEQDFISKPLLIKEIVHPDFVEYFEEQWSDLVKGKVAPTYEYKIIDPDGKERWIFQSNRGVFDDNGKIVAMEGICRDVTDRKLAEEALLESEERFQIAINNSPIVVFNQDNELRYTWVYNPTPGFEADKVLGKTDADLLPANEAKQLMDIKRKVLETGIGAREEVTTTHKDKARYYDLTVEPLRDSSGSIVGVTCASMDITDNKKAEEDLIESEERYKSLVELAPESIVTVDLKGVITSCNPAYYKLTGYRPEEVVGLHISKVQTWRAKDIPEYLKIFASMMRGKAPDLVEFKWRHKNGTVRIGEAHISLKKKDNKVTGIQAIVRDITEQQQAANNLKQSYDKLSRIWDGTINTLAAIVEMRDPYTAGHQQRVADLACAIGREMGLSNEQVDKIDIASRLHDVGKISVPTEILSKPGRINQFEFDIIKGHPQIGYDILKNIELEWPIAEIILQHHERLDGSSYPRGLSGKDIILEARIVAVADVVEAMSSHRPYRPALGIDKALEEISKNKGILYDPDVVNACLTLFNKKIFKF